MIILRVVYTIELMLFATLLMVPFEWSILQLSSLMQYMKKDGEGVSLSVQQERLEKNGGKYTNQINWITAMHSYYYIFFFFYLFATIFWLALQGGIEKFSIWPNRITF